MLTRSLHHSVLYPSYIRAVYVAFQAVKLDVTGFGNLGLVVTMNRHTAGQEQATWAAKATNQTTLNILQISNIEALGEPAFVA